MYENIILYKPEYMLNEDGKRQRFKVNEEGLFALKDGRFVTNPGTSDTATSFGITVNNLIADEDGGILPKLAF